MARESSKDGVKSVAAAAASGSLGARLRARRAQRADAAAIHALVAQYAAEGLLLPRTAQEIFAHVDHFVVAVENGRLLGCVALEPYGAALAEIRSLAVAPEARGSGLGARLLRYALREARRRGFTRVFAVTHAAEFFVRQGFAPTVRQAIPEKIARDCNTCPKEPSCKLVALVTPVNSERDALPILNNLAASP